MGTVAEAPLEPGGHGGYARGDFVFSCAGLAPRALPLMESLMTPVSRRALSFLASAGFALSIVTGASAQSIPDKEINRDLVRRALLDTCVYAEAAKEGAKKEKVVDGCQCASFKAMKPVTAEEVTKMSSDRVIPDELYRATTEAFGTCVR